MVYVIGNTYKITVSVTKSDGSAATVESCELTVRNSNGVAAVDVNIGDLSKEDTGTYSYEWETDGESYGDYFVEAKGTMQGGKPFRITDTVTLEA